MTERSPVSPSPIKRRPASSISSWSSWSRSGKGSSTNSWGSSPSDAITRKASAEDALSSRSSTWAARLAPLLTRRAASAMRTLSEGLLCQVWTSTPTETSECTCTRSPPTFRTRSASTALPVTTLTGSLGGESHWTPGLEMLATGRWKIRLPWPEPRGRQEPPLAGKVQPRLEARYLRRTNHRTEGWPVLRPRRPSAAAQLPPAR